MTDDQKKTLEDLLDQGLTADFNFGGLFKGLESIIEGVGKLQDLAEKTGAKRTTRQFSIPGLGKRGQGVFGFSISTLDSGKVKVEPFGNVRKTERGPEVEQAREPMVDIFEEQDTLQVLAEMPGVDEASIETEIRGDILTITGSGRRCCYAKEVLLPFAVKEDGVTKGYRNGILELKLDRA